MTAEVRRGHLECRDERGSYRIPLGRRSRKCLAVLDKREGEFVRSLELDLFTGFVYYCVDKNDLPALKKAYEDAIAEALTVIDPYMTDYEKEEAVYLWLTKEMKADTGILTVIPTSSEGADDPHDVLKNHNAVCVGYATTFRLFMQIHFIASIVFLKVIDHFPACEEKCLKQDA